MATLADIYRELNRSRAMFDSFRPIIDEAAKVARYVNKMCDDMEKFRRDSELVAGYYRDTIRKYFAEHGWYVGASLTARQLATLKRLIPEGGHEADIEAFMVDHVRSTLTEIENSAFTAWPNRKPILEDAFSAHRSGQYSLSIPCLLAQADGMAFDILDAFAFTNHSGNISAKTRQLIDSDIPSYSTMSSYVGILLEDAAMRDRTGVRDEKRDLGAPMSPLNRHGVMHGIDTDYPNEANSLRVVSLIGLLATIHGLKNSDEEDG
ncbi:MAG: hypothetical protein GXP26_14885 [Planctomycetes bacterium]|nr:hypothetical protein [Planctomycetota bacterium]